MFKALGVGNEVLSTGIVLWNAYSTDLIRPDRRRSGSGAYYI